MSRAMEFLYAQLPPFQCDTLEFSQCLEILSSKSSPGINLSQKDKESVINSPYLRALVSKSSYEVLQDGLVSISSLKLKDELRDIERVQLCKTRIFTNCSIEVVAAGVMLFYHQNNGMSEVTLNNPISYAMNPCQEFKHIYRVFKEREMLGFTTLASDCSNFDNSYSVTLFQVVASFRLLLAPTKFTEIFNYYNCIINSKVEVLGEVRNKPPNLPSGCFTTITDNTILQILLLYYSAIIQDVEISDLVVKAAGDDLLMSVPSNFNIEKVIETYKFFGITINFEQHNGIDNVSFLNRTFKYVDHIKCVVPICDPVRVVEALAYQSKEETYRERFCGLLFHLYPHYELFKFYKLKYENMFKVRFPLSDQEMNNLYL